jgi:hypothetical protein
MMQGEMAEYAARISARFPQLFQVLGSPTLDEDFELAATDILSSVEETPEFLLMKVRLPRQRVGASLTTRMTHDKPPLLPGDIRATTRAVDCDDDQDQALSPFSKSRKFIKPSRSNSFDSVSSTRAGSISSMTSSTTCDSRFHSTAQGDEYPVCLSSAGLSQLSAARHPGDNVDPGKPALSSPGSHDPWASFTGDDDEYRILSPFSQSRDLIKSFAYVNTAQDQEYPVRLSSAGLNRLSAARRRGDNMDPGKPVLSSPGSYDPWASFTLMKRKSHISQVDLELCDSIA